MLNIMMIYYGTFWYGLVVLHHKTASCSYNIVQYSTIQSIVRSISYSFKVQIFVYINDVQWLPWQCVKRQVLQLFLITCQHNPWPQGLYSYYLEHGKWTCAFWFYEHMDPQKKSGICLGCRMRILVSLPNHISVCITYESNLVLIVEQTSHPMNSKYPLMVSVTGFMLIWSGHRIYS